MSAFTPYKTVLPNVALGLAQAEESEKVLPDFKKMLQMYTVAVFGIGITGPSRRKIEPQPSEKGSKFLMKNILKDIVEKEADDQIRLDNEQAAQVEVLASNMGKLGSGHRCIYCGKIYSRKYGLKIHIRTHTGYKPLKCKHCSRPFGDPSNLNKHIRLHSEGATPYRCAECGKVMVRKRDLDRHVSSRHSFIKAKAPTPGIPILAQGRLPKDKEIMHLRQDLPSQKKQMFSPFSNESLSCRKALAPDQSDHGSAQ